MRLDTPAPSPTQPRKSLFRVQTIVERISFLDRTFHVEEKGDGFLLQVRYPEADIETGKIEIQHARKHYVSAFSTESEIVETAHYAVLRSMQHVVGEHFLYRGRRVYSPHFEIGARVDLCDGGRFDGRIPPPAAMHPAGSKPSSRDHARACDDCGEFHAYSTPCSNDALAIMRAIEGGSVVVVDVDEAAPPCADPGAIHLVTPPPVGKLGAP